MTLFRMPSKLFGDSRVAVGSMSSSLLLFELSSDTKDDLEKVMTWSSAQQIKTLKIQRTDLETK